MKKMLPILLAASVLSLSAGQPAFAQDAATVEASLSADQLELLNSLPADVRAALLQMGLSPAQLGAAVAAVSALPAALQVAVAQLPPAQRAELVSAVVEIQSTVQSGNAANVAAATARLNSAVQALPPAVRGDLAVAVAAQVQATVASLPPTSPIRTVAAAAIVGVGQVAVANGASAAQLATIEQAALVAQADAPAPETIGAIEPNPQGSPTNG